MYSEILIIEETSLSRFFGSGARQTSEVESTRQTVSCSTQPVNSTSSVEPELGGQRVHLVEHLAVAHEHGVPVAATALQRRERPDRVIDAVLRAHDADVAEQVALAALERGIGRNRREARQVGPGADDEHVLGRRRRPRVIATWR